MNEARTGALATTNSGTESEYACATAVMMLVRPGPEITKAAAGRPLKRANPSAAKPAPLLVPHQHVADVRRGQTAIQLQVVHAGNAEHGVDIVGGQ